MSIKKGIKKVGGSIKNNSPVILTSIGVIGTVSTAVLASKATIKAEKYLREEYTEAYEMGMPFMETFLIVWKIYIPTIIVGSATIMAIIGANKAYGRKHAALTGMYALTEKTLETYKNEVVDTIGKNKEKEISEKVSNRMVEQVEDDTNIIQTGNGEHLCYDTLSGRYFRSDIETVRKAQNDMNHELFSEMWGSLNSFYRYLELPSIKLGEELGWNVDDPLDIEFSSTVTKKGEPCLVIRHKTLPTTTFRDW